MADEAPTYADLPDDPPPPESPSPGTGLGSALTQALSAQNVSTAEAHGYDKRILERALSGEDQSGESDILSQMQQGASEARQALQQARERLLSRQIDPREQAFARAAAWMAPSRTGRFGDTLSNVASTLSNQYAQQRQFQQAQDQGLFGIDSQLANVDQGTLAAKLALQKLHEQGLTSLAGHALTDLGRPLQGAANTKLLGPQSPEGKQAMDEGLSPGTPDYQSRVQDLVSSKVAATKARAGIDTSGDSSPDAKAALADAVGVPADVPDPWAGLPTRSRLVEQQNEAKIAQKHLDTYPAADAQTQNALRLIDEFQALNAKTHTGPELAAMRVGDVSAGLHGVGVRVGQDHGFNINPLSWAPAFNSNIQRMDKDANNLVGLAIPEKGFGRVTNLDMGVFRNGMLSVERSPATNNAIAQALKIRMQNDLDRHEYEQNYFQTHQHLRGAEASWNSYLNANPIFDPAHANDKGTTKFTLNPNRQSYSDYFRQQNAKGRPGVSDEDANDPALAGLSPAQIAAAKQPAEARGGSIGFAEGGSTAPDDDDNESPTIKQMLAALRSGATLKTVSGGEEPNSSGTNLALEGTGAAGAVGALALLARRLGVSPAKVISNPHLQAALVGGGAGALAGAASNPESPIAGAVGSGLTGAALGPLARLGVRGVVNTGGRLLDRATGNTVTPGARSMIDAITSDNPDFNAVAAGLRKDAAMRVPSTLGDSVGPRTTGLATAALTKDTPETAAYAQQLADRQGQANTRVSDQVNRAFKPDPYLQKQQDLTTALYANAKPLYEAAYAAHPAVQSQALTDLMDTPAGQEAASRAFVKMQNLQMPIGSPDATGMVRSPSLQYLDQVKRSLDDMITQEEGSGPSYSATDDGRILRGMRNKLVAGVDAATAGPNGQPGLYQQARQQYAGDLEVRDALRSGNEDFARLTPSELAAKTQGMSYAEKDAFLSGVSENLFNRLGNTPDNVSPSARIASTPALKEKLTALFDKPSDAVRFLSSLDRESDLFAQSKQMLSTSGKAQAASMSPASLTSAARARLMRPDTASEIASIAATPAGPDTTATLARLRDQADRLTKRSTVGNIAGNAAAAGLATGLTPSDSNSDATAAAQ